MRTADAITLGDTGHVEVRVGLSRYKDDDGKKFGHGGEISLETGPASNGQGGSIFVTLGEGDSGSGGNITMTAGNTTDKAFNDDFEPPRLQGWYAWSAIP